MGRLTAVSGVIVTAAFVAADAGNSWRARAGEEVATSEEADSEARDGGAAAETRSGDELLDLARRYAEAASGGQKNATYYKTLQEAAIKLKLSAIGEDGTLRTSPDRLEPIPDPISSPFVKVRARAAERASLFDHETWRNNFDKWLETPDDDPLRIWGGEPAAPGELADCVAVGNATGFCCTGTRIGPNVVLTAAHCFEGDCPEATGGRVYIGNNSNQPSTGRVVKVKKVLPFRSSPAVAPKDDLALLILEEKITDPPSRRIATSADIDAASHLLLAGFGLTENNTFGRKFKVEVIIASNSCAPTQDQNAFGCLAGLEIVAGGNGFDSCNGDSGGPAYVEKDGELFLAGATSRAAEPFNPLEPCRPGGIYVRVDKYLDKIRQLAEDNGGELADSE